MLERSCHLTCCSCQAYCERLPSTPAQRHSWMRSSHLKVLQIFDVRLCRISLSLFHFFEGSHRTMQRMPVIPPELRVGAFERRVSVGLGLLDAAFNLLVSLHPYHSPIYWNLCVLIFANSNGAGYGEIRTRSCAPSSPGCAGTSSWILQIISIQSLIAEYEVTYWPLQRFGDSDCRVKVRNVNPRHQRPFSEVVKF